MLDKLKAFFQNRTNAILVGVLVLLIAGGIFGAFKLFGGNRVEGPLQEVELPFDPDGPFALLVPRRDGDALYLNIFRISAYDSILYELAYTSDASEIENFGGEEGDGEGEGRIPRGVTGTFETKGKGEYSQEILFGTCSQGFNTGAHCVFDKDVREGTLLLRIQKGRTVYKMLTTWNKQQPDVALGEIVSSDGHFKYKSGASKEELVNAGYTITNDLSGVPKLPEGKEVLGKVYALNVPDAKGFPKGDVTIELAQNPPAEAKIYRYVEAENKWVELGTKVEGSKLSASSDGAGIFAVLTNQS